MRPRPQPWQTAHRLGQEWAAGPRFHDRSNCTAQYTAPSMAVPPLAAARPFDSIATAAALRRLARAPAPPWLHVEVARRMAERLEFIRVQPDWLIDWWSFLGAGSDVLQRVYPQAGRIIVEPTVELLARSRAAAERPWWAKLGRGRPLPELLLEGDDIQARVQLVWANVMLHAVADPPALFERWERLLGADGFVMFSCLGPGTLRELRALYAWLGWPSPTPSFIDMHDLGDMLVHAGFADPVMDQETLTVRWTDPEKLLDELRGLGGNAAPGRFQGLRTRRWRARLEEELAASAGADGRITMRFEVAYGHAFKALPRVPAGQPTTVSLDEMRGLVRSRRK